MGQENLKDSADYPSRIEWASDRMMYHEGEEPESNLREGQLISTIYITAW